MIINVVGDQTRAKAQLNIIDMVVNSGKGTFDIWNLHHRSEVDGISFDLSDGSNGSPVHKTVLRTLGKKRAHAINKFIAGMHIMAMDMMITKFKNGTGISMRGACKKKKTLVDAKPASRNTGYGLGSRN